MGQRSYCTCCYLIFSERFIHSVQLSFSPPKTDRAGIAFTGTVVLMQLIEGFSINGHKPVIMQSVDFKELEVSYEKQE